MKLNQPAMGEKFGPLCISYRQIWLYIQIIFPVRRL